MNWRSREERRQSLLQMADVFEQGVLGLVEGVNDLAGRSHAGEVEHMAGNAEQTGRQSVTVATAAEAAAASAETVSAAAGNSCRRSTKSPCRPGQIARDALDDAAWLLQGGDELQRPSSIWHGSLDPIQSIASQTNLLALNATIERRGPAKPAKASPSSPPR